MQPKRFSEFAKEERPLDGEKVKLETVLNRGIVILGYRIKESRYAKKNSNICLTLQFEMDGTRHVLFTGSTVLADQVEKYKDEIPFLAAIVKIDKYYTFT